jgi:hypothetical protein
MFLLCLCIILASHKYDIEVEFHKFQTSALDDYELSASHLATLLVTEQPSVPTGQEALEPVWIWQSKRHVMKSRHRVTILAYSLHFD